MSINDQIYASHNCYTCGSEHDGPDNNCSECEHGICCANARAGEDDEEFPDELYEEALEIQAEEQESDYVQAVAAERGEWFNYRTCPHCRYKDMGSNRPHHCEELDGRVVEYSEMNPGRCHIDAFPPKEILHLYRVADYTLTIVYNKNAAQPYVFTLRNGDDVLRTADDTLAGAAAVARQSFKELHRKGLITEAERAEYISRVTALRDPQ